MPTNNVLPNLEGYSLINSDEQNFARSNCIWDTSKGLFDDTEDINTSYSATFPAMFQVNTVPTETVVQVQAKIHYEAEWLTLWTSSEADPHYISQWSMPYNFMRAIRTSGTGDVKAFQTMFAPDHVG
jgi:hypothetical protein